MHKSIIAGLIAATLVPTFAQAQPELRRDRRDIRQEQRDVDRAIRNGAPGYVVRNEQRDVREARREYRDDRRDYRNDRRNYRDDWRDYRRRNPAVYRGPAYVGPRGYAYRPIGVGYRFQPAYYDRRYWVDPYRYRLAPVGPNQRWVRYGRDVVRVDIRNGRALQIFGSFFL